MGDENDEYINRQIAVYKTSKGLIEFIDKLKPASVYNYAKIHAGTDEKWNNKRLVSCIGIRIGNYAEKPAKYVEANVSPEDIKILYQYASKAMFGKNLYQTLLKEEKIIAAAIDKESGLAPVTKLIISRQQKDNKGNLRKNPIIIQIENGSGIPVKTSTNGTACKSGSYKLDKKLFISQKDIDFYKLVSDVYRFLNVWEISNGSRLYQKMKKLRERQIENKKN